MSKAEKTVLESKIATGLVRLRKFRNVTQEKLAGIVDTNRVVIARIENGMSTPSLDFIQKIAQALDAEVEISFKPISNQEVFSTTVLDKGNEYICVDCSNQWYSKFDRSVLQCPQCHKRQGIRYSEYLKASKAVQNILKAVKASPPFRKAPPIRSVKNNAPVMFKLIRETVGGTFPNPRLPFSLLFKIFEQAREKEIKDKSFKSNVIKGKVTEMT
jgi:transcriptional regulator with XRE-family HTH domain